MDPEPAGAPLGRREVLAALLGVPLAASACRHLPRRSIDGDIRGGSHGVGHRLRDVVVEHVSGEPRRVGVAIVGAGAAGLSAAWRLERLGYRDFVVLDLEATPGGTSAFGTDGVVPYPWGAHYVPVPAADNAALVTLLREVGAIEGQGGPRGREGHCVREPEERVFIDERWHEGLFPRSAATAVDLEQLTRFTRETAALAELRDARGRRAFVLPLARCSDESQFTDLDKVSAATWLESHGYRSPFLKWYVDYACRDDYGLTVEQTSAWAMLFYFASRLPRSGEPSAPLLTWPEGNGRLVKHLASVAGRRLELGRLVTDVSPSDASVDLAVFDAKSGGVLRYRCEQAILAVPQFLARRVLRPWRSSPPEHVGAFSYGSWMVANLHLSGRPRSPGFPFAWDNVLFDSPSLGYVVATHQTLSDLGPTIWTYYQPLLDDDPRAAREKLLGLTHRDFCDSILADLGRAHRGLESLVERIDVWRWGHAMVRPTPGFLWSSARRAARTALGRVHFAHTDLSGVALFEEAQYHGVVAAEAVLRAAGREVTGLYDG